MARSRTTFLPISVMRRVGADLPLMGCKANSRTFCATRQERFTHEACRAALSRMATYGPTDFNKWDVFYAMAVSKATNLGIDKHRKRDGGGGGGGAKGGGGRELSARTHNRLNKERAHYVGAAASYGWTTPLGSMSVKLLV